jgi:hypothetical protein
MKVEYAEDKGFKPVSITLETDGEVSYVVAIMREYLRLFYLDKDTLPQKIIDELIAKRNA